LHNYEPNASFFVVILVEELEWQSADVLGLMANEVIETLVRTALHDAPEEE
jgi:hypothetical protein